MYESIVVLSDGETWMQIEGTAVWTFNTSEISAEALEDFESSLELSADFGNEVAKKGEVIPIPNLLDAYRLVREFAEANDLDGAWAIRKCREVIQ